MLWGMKGSANADKRWRGGVGHPWPNDNVQPKTQG